MIMSSATTWSSAISTIWPSRKTWAVLACKLTKRWIASDVRPLAFASRKRPSKINATITAAAS